MGIWQVARIAASSPYVNETEFEDLVRTCYQDLYRFALSLTRNEADACDLTQQTFYRYAECGHQVRDRSRAKGWLLTTLHRLFLAGRRHETRFPQVNLDDSEADLPVIAPTAVESLDGATVMEALLGLDDLYRAPLELFYVENQSYEDIARILDIPVGTVMSRLSRGKKLLRRRLASRDERNAAKVIPLDSHAATQNSQGTQS
jgi:RNA polymerase sigma-70 factor (ECF subfamily)